LNVLFKTSCVQNQFFFLKNQNETDLQFCKLP